MNSITIVECHTLNENNVKVRIDSYLDSIKTQNDAVVDAAEVDWNGNNGQFKMKIAGMKLNGLIKVEEEFVTLKGELPALVSDYQRDLEHIIRVELYKLLN
jgi:hypothetical protein